MTIETIKNDYQLTLKAKSIASDIVENSKQYGGVEWFEELQRRYDERVYDFVDSSEYVIYYHHANAICCNCDVTQGEDLADPLDRDGEFIGLDRLHTQVVFYELHARVMGEVQTLIDDLECHHDEVAA
jgi:hypothetical protein